MYDAFATEMIDPNLKYVKRFPQCSTDVFEVKKGKTKFILKSANDKWTIKHLKKETKILDLAKEINGITHLVNVYDMGTSDYSYSILKEFYSGKTLFEMILTI